jgi:3-methyladenine DNA glycosylase/8-oxoguanine DNA glycosylase
MSDTFAVPVQSPYPWRSILDYLAPRSTPGAESVEAGRYVRQTSAGAVTVEYDPAALVLRCAGEKVTLPRIERLFDAGHDPRAVNRALRGSPLLGPKLRALPGVRAPGCWEPFELCLRVILGQQVSVKAAHTLMGRLTARCPGLDPGQVAEADLATLGLPGARLRTVRTFAERVAAGTIRLEGQSWDETAGQLKESPGFGPWTLQYLAIRLGRDSDAFPETDLGLLRAAGAQTPRELLRMADQWRPWRGYAAMCLWMAH